MSLMTINKHRIIQSSYYPSGVSLSVWFLHAALSFICSRQRTKKNAFSVSHLERSINTFSRSKNFSPLQPVSTMFPQNLYSKKDREPGIMKFTFPGKQ